jgi:hypothetical protein
MSTLKNFRLSIAIADVQLVLTSSYHYPSIAELDESFSSIVNVPSTEGVSCE